MGSPFLLSFSEAVIAALIRGDQLEMQAGGRNTAVRFLADRLARARQGHSLVSTLSSALLACPQVEELFADDDLLRDLITNLPREVLPR